MSITPVSPKDVFLPVAEDALKSALNKMLDVLQGLYPWPYDTTKLDCAGFELDLSVVKMHLRECLQLTHGNEKERARIKDALDEHQGIFSGILKNALQKEDRECVLLLLDLKMEALATENFIYFAAEKGDAELVEKFLSLLVIDDHFFDANVHSLLLARSLRAAARAKSPKCIKLLLQAGANPTERGSEYRDAFEIAVTEGNLECLGLFFRHSKFKLDAATTYSKLQAGKLPGRSSKENNRCSLATALPPLIPKGKIRCFSNCAFSAVRRLCIKQYIDPFLHPLPAVKHLVAPLIQFMEKQTKYDPRCAIYFLQQGSEKGLEGRFEPETGNIRIYLPVENFTTDPFVKVVEDIQQSSGIEGITGAKVVHEVVHMAAYNIFKTLTCAPASPDFERGVQQDIAKLKKDGWIDAWKECHHFTADFMHKVEGRYRELRYGEYLARLPEIGCNIAYKHPEYSSQQVDAILEKDLPYLFKFYMKEFVPALQSY